MALQPKTRGAAFFNDPRYQERPSMKQEISLCPNRNEGIDIFRGISIISVILLHCYVHLPFAKEMLQDGGRVLNIIFRSGYYGVKIFFVVSGFLITMTSLKGWGSLEDLSWRQFYHLRFARIAPCLLLLVLVSSVLHLTAVPAFTLQKTSLAQTIFATLTFTLNWLEAKTGYFPANWDVLWSLSVEEMFYFFFPVACVVLKKKKYLVGMLVAFIAMGPLARTVFTTNEIWSDHSYLSCMDGIAIGCLAALVSFQYSLSSKQFFATLISGLLLFVFIFIFRKQAFEIGLAGLGLNETILEIGLGLILVAMQEWYVKGADRSSKYSALVRWFGRHSYEIYLTHGFIVFSIAKVFILTGLSGSWFFAWSAVVVILSGISGRLIAVYFSEPMNKLIRSTGISGAQTAATTVREGN
jgi:peptidoglycan/LPS O-acetylase OafA/YrhL